MYNRRTFLKNNFCCNCPCSADEVRRGTAHLRADAPAGDIDLLLRQHALIEHSLILLFHTYRAAATEFPVTAAVAAKLRAALPELEVLVSTENRDPYTYL